MLKTLASIALIGFSLNSFAAPAADHGDFLLKHNLVDGPDFFGDSDVKHIPYDQLMKGLADLAARYPERAKVVKFGKTILGRDLNVLRIEDTSSGHVEPGRAAVEISGAIHGNEYLGIEDKLAAYFLEHTDKMPGLSLYLAAGGVIYVIPVINPDGYEALERGNKNGTDLNRDFDILPTHENRFTQPETSALKNFLDQDLTASQLKLRFVMDYHCCVPALITPWTYVDEHPAQKDLAAYNEVIDLQKKLLGYDAGNAADTVGYLAVGSSLDYFYAKYGTTAFTIEGRYRGEESKFEKHAELFDAVFEKLAIKQLGID